MKSEKWLLELIVGGESQEVEFKKMIDSSAAKDLVAFLNSNDGWIIFGVSDTGELVGLKDKNPDKVFAEKVVQGIVPSPVNFIKTYEVEIDKKKIFFVNVKHKKGILFSFGGRVYIRVGSLSRPLGIDELLVVAHESVVFRFDEQIRKDVDFRYVDKSVLNEFVETLGIKDVFGGLKSLKLIEIVGKKKFLTNAGILFLTRNPDRFIPGAKVKVLVFKKGRDEVVELMESSGPIWKIIDKITEFVIEKGFVIKYKTGVKHKKIFSVPIQAFREALINALAHRNYLVPGEIIIEVRKDSIEIKNPGGFPPGVSPDKPFHAPRNEVLCNVFFRLGFVEKFGVGIQRIRRWCREYGLDDPIFYTDGFTSIKFLLQRKKVNVEERIIDLLKEKPEGISSGELCKHLGISKPTVVKILSRLVKKRVVKAVGKGKFRRYLLRGPNL